MQGKIIKGIAGFYYVHVVGSGVYECRAKGVFRNRKMKPLVGDNVIIDVLDEGEKRERVRNPATEKGTDPSGSCEYRSGTFDLCSSKTDTEL